MAVVAVVFPCGDSAQDHKQSCGLRPDGCEQVTAERTPIQRRTCGSAPAAPAGQARPGEAGQAGFSCGWNLKTSGLLLNKIPVGMCSPPAYRQFVTLDFGGLCALHMRSEVRHGTAPGTQLEKSMFLVSF